MPLPCSHTKNFHADKMTVQCPKCKKEFPVNPGDLSCELAAHHAECVKVFPKVSKAEVSSKTKQKNKAGKEKARHRVTCPLKSHESIFHLLPFVLKCRRESEHQHSFLENNTILFAQSVSNSVSFLLCDGYNLRTPDMIFFDPYQHIFCSASEPEQQLWNSHILSMLA